MFLEPLFLEPLFLEPLSTPQRQKVGGQHFMESMSNSTRQSMRRPTYARTFKVALGLLTSLLLSAQGCVGHVAKVPTRPLPPAAGSPDLHAEVLDTEDGPIPIDIDDPQKGARTAPCVIVVFSDFQCPFCREAANSLTRLQAELPGKVRLVFKHLPIPMHSDALRAALAAQVVWLEAGSKGFWSFHDRCFSNPHDLDVGHLTTWAGEVGVRIDAFERRASEAEVLVRRHVKLAERLKIEGTPRMYINHRKVEGAYPYEQMRAWVDKEL